jgi:hypothetical protein
VFEILSANPWLVAVAEIGAVVLGGIVCISVCVCMRKIRLAKYDFELKRDMVQRGLSAEEIRTVIEAGRQSRHAASRASWAGRSAGCPVQGGSGPTASP